MEEGEGLVSRLVPLALTTCTLCNYSCSPIRLQNGLWNVILTAVTHKRDPTHLQKMMAVAADPRGATRAEISYALAEINLEITGYFGNQVEIS